VDESLIAIGDFTQQGGYIAMQKLLPQRPDAVFAASDITAVGAIRAIQESGLRVPEDIAIVGFDDIPMPTLTSVQLTTVRQPVEGLGEAAVNLLIELIENGIQPHRHTILETELVVRSSSGNGKHS
jgi:DNA-binding LacI/PurR family transcriptional regulator